MQPSRATLVVGNWKMHRLASEATALAQGIVSRVRPAPGREVAIAPPFTALPAVTPLLAGTALRLAAQDLFWEPEGAYTGEISPLMLRDLGVVHVIVGHSERRIHLAETDHMVNRKVRAALRSDLRPILCVGEREEERASGRAAAVVREQVLRGLEELPAGSAERLAIAYEPVWAIGTGRVATAADIIDMHAQIRSALLLTLGAGGAAPRILYGGSVSAANIDGLMALQEVDGVLVGGASLHLEDFARICDYR